MPSEPNRIARGRWEAAIAASIRGIAEPAWGGRMDGATGAGDRRAAGAGRLRGRAVRRALAAFGGIPAGQRRRLGYSGRARARRAAVGLPAAGGRLGAGLAVGAAAARAWADQRRRRPNAGERAGGRVMAMSEAERDAFVNRPLTAVLATAWQDGRVHAVPVWYRYADGVFTILTER